MILYPGIWWTMPMSTHPDPIVMPEPSFLANLGFWTFETVLICAMAVIAFRMWRNR